MEAALKIRPDGLVEVRVEDQGARVEYEAPFEAVAHLFLAAAQEERQDEEWLATPVLPPGTVAFARAERSGNARLWLAWGPGALPFDYEGTLFEAIPYPRLVFGLRLQQAAEGWRVLGVEVAAVKERGRLAPSAPLFHYPYSHVWGLSMCTGHAPLPVLPDLAEADTWPRFILTVPNSDHHYDAHQVNRSGLVLRQLLEELDGAGEFPEEWLAPLDLTLGEWVQNLKR